MKINRVNNFNLQNKQNFGAFLVSPKYMDELHTTIFENKKTMIDDFDKIVGILKEAQKDNPKCNIELFQGANPLTGDSCPTMNFVDKDGATITQIYTHHGKYNKLSEACSMVQMCADANNIANQIRFNFETLLESLFRQ